MASYSLYTMAELSTELALRLYDVNGEFWSDAERQQRIGDAIRLWNMLSIGSPQWYPLNITLDKSPWFDLNVITGSPREALMTNQDIYSRLQYHLLEDQIADCGLLTGQFTTDALVNATMRKRDEFLFRTNCDRTTVSLPVNANEGSVSLPQTVIQVQRGYWLPATGGTAFPIFRGDQQGRAAFSMFPKSGDPYIYEAGIEPPLMVELYPTPGYNGTVEFTVTEIGATLTASNVTRIFVPQDCIPTLAWGAIAELLGGNSEASDPQRAAYAQKRFDMVCDLMPSIPFLMGARVGGVDAMIGTTDSLDLWMPTWRSPMKSYPVVAAAGQNLICFPSDTVQTITILVNANANVPASGGYVQFGNEVLEAILGMAQHEAQFKQGIYELNQSMPLFENFMDMAKKRNSKLEALSTYADFMKEGIQKSEDAEQPMEA